MTTRLTYLCVLVELTQQRDELDEKRIEYENQITEQRAISVSKDKVYGDLELLKQTLQAKERTVAVDRENIAKERMQVQQDVQKIEQEQALQMNSFQQKVVKEHEMLQASLKTQMSQNRKLKEELEEKSRAVDNQKNSDNDELAVLRQQYSQEKQRRVDIERRLRTLLNQQSMQA